MIWWLLLAAAVVGLGAWGWSQARTPESFFVASRRAGAVLAGLAGTAAGLSAFVFVGGPGYFAAVGIASLWIILSAPLTGALQCWAVGERIVDMARHHHCLTVPDLVAARFGEGAPPALAAVAVALGAVATLAVQIKGVAVIGHVLLGMPGWLVAGAAILATTAYAAAGGMRAGLPAEAVQGVVMAIAAVTVTAAALARAGGPVAAVRAIAAARPALLDAWGPGGPTAGLGLFALFALGTCAQPHYLQKFLLLRDRESLRWMPLVMTVALLAVLTVWVGVGIGGTALWLGGEIGLSSPDQLAPALLAVLGNPGLVTITVVAVIAAVMSTAASLLNLTAAAVTRDLPRALGLAAPAGLAGARFVTVLAAAAAAGLALLSTRSVALLGVLGWGTFTAALLPVMVLGLGWRGASRPAAVAALIVGPLVQLAVEGARQTDLLGRSWEPGLTGAAAGVTIMVILSACRRPVPRLGTEVARP